MNTDRFWAHVDRGDGCWLWTGALTRGSGKYPSGGYGKYATGLAHRISYELTNGPIPEGLELDHLCRTKHCVNPAHLEAVTRAENIRRRVSSYTECVNGHEYTPENTYVSPTGRRNCRTCQRNAVSRYKARKVQVAS